VGEANKTIRDTDAEAVALARELIRAARHGALAVLDPETGAPAASRVAVAADEDGAPLALLSALAAHTKALLADPRCSLLLGEPGKGDPLADPRISLACRARRLEPGTPEAGKAQARYLEHHPKAKLYAGFADFSVFRIEPEHASLVAGFGKAYRLTREDLLAGSVDEAG
jgi:putative heme iron utilization protein